MRIADLAGFGFGCRRYEAIGDSECCDERIAPCGYRPSVWRYHTVTLQQWVMAYVITGAMGAIYALWTASQHWGIPAWDASVRPRRQEDLFQRQ